MKQLLKNPPKKGEALLFRPHHFLCTLGFQGKGYSRSFIQNFQELKNQLDTPEGEKTLLQVTLIRDTICDACPNVRESSCTTLAKIQVLDQAHLSILGLKEGDVLTWKEAKERIKSRISVETFHTICAPCTWKSLGVCEQSLENLLKS